MSGPADNVLRSVTLTVSIPCGQCAQPVPVNGPVQMARCPHCTRGTPVPDLFEILCVAAGHMQPREYQFKSFDEPAVECSGCGKDVSLAPYLRVEGALPAVACPSCQAPVHVYPAPHWLKEHHPTALHVFGGDDESAAEQGSLPLVVNEAARRPVAMACPACGGGLTLTHDDARTAACKFCSASVFIPEELWKLLHPVKIMQRWTLSYTGKLRSPTFDLLEELRRRTGRAGIETEVISCPECQKRNPGHYEFCLGCGAALPRDGAGPVARDDSSDVPEAPAVGRGRSAILFAVFGGLAFLLIAAGGIFALRSSHPAAPDAAHAKPHAGQKR